MNIRPLVIAALGIGMAAALPAVAQAYPSYTTGSVNLRAGPGTGYTSYGALPPGLAIDVHYCQPGWCRTLSAYGTGWVSTKYLSGGPVRLYPRMMPPPYMARPYGYPPPPPPFFLPRPGFGFYFRAP